MLFALAFILPATACSRSSGPVVLTADTPLHLEDHLDAARFSEVAVPSILLHGGTYVDLPGWRREEWALAALALGHVR